MTELYQTKDYNSTIGYDDCYYDIDELTQLDIAELAADEERSATERKARKLLEQRYIDRINDLIAVAADTDRAERDITRLRPGITYAARRWAVLDRLAYVGLLERIGLQRFLAGLDLFLI